MQSTILNEIKARGRGFYSCSTAKHRLKDSHLNVFLLFIYTSLPVTSVNLFPNQEVL